jgi:hypothetical protein
MLDANEAGRIWSNAMTIGRASPDCFRYAGVSPDTEL